MGGYSMRKTYKALALGLGISVLLGGCDNMNANGENPQGSQQNASSNKNNTYEKENFVRIQDYTGEGFTLRDSKDENQQIALDHQAEIENAVLKFFQDRYKTEVNIHNTVGATDGVTVFVESKGEPHFYSYAIVPIKEKRVITDEVWSEDGQVEDAISGALYAMAFDQEIINLDTYLEGIAKELSLTGTPLEAIQNVGGKGYTTPYYYINPVGDVFDELYNMYIENPTISKVTLQTFLQEKDFQPEDITLTVYLYMKEEAAEPDKATFDRLVSDIENMENIPRGSYSIVLNDNLIDSRRAIGIKENSLKRSAPNEIIRE